MEKVKTPEEDRKKRVTGECNFALPVPLIIAHNLYGDKWRGTNNF